MSAQPLELRDFSMTRKDLLHARHLPGEFYTSTEIFKREIEQIFMKDWICIGRVEQFANPGDYRALRIAGEPLIVCRDQGGTLRAFANVCQHRGVEVAQGAGNAKEFSCPYHGWLYDLKGELIGAPYSKEVPGYDWKSCRMPPIRLDTWAGYVFVNFDAAAESLATYLAADSVQEVAGFLRAEDTRIAD